MQFGIFHELTPGPKPWDEGREIQVIEEGVVQAVKAEEWGYDFFWETEHHFLGSHSASSAPEIFLTWVAAHTKKIRIGHAVVLASREINHPWRVAERAATLDILSKGRLDLGFGRGVTTTELYAFQADPRQTREQRIDMLKMLPGMWTQDEFSYKSENYDLPPVTLTPKPYQQPHPPLWMACGGEQSWKEAAELGVGAMSFGFATPGRLEACIKGYDEAIKFARPTYGPVNAQKACSTFMFCAETEDEALENAAQMVPMLIGVLEYYLTWEKMERPVHGFEQYGKDYMEKAFPGISSGKPHKEIIREFAKSEAVLVGTPAQIMETVKKYRDTGIDKLAVIAQYGKLSQEQVLSSMRLFSDGVMARM